LRQFCGGREQEEIAIPAATVGDALQSLWEAHPGLRDRILTEQGHVRQHINIFVGNESIQHSGGLSTPLPDAAEIMIVPAVSGGSSAEGRYTELADLKSRSNFGNERRVIQRLANSE